MFMLFYLDNYSETCADKSYRKLLIAIVYYTNINIICCCLLLSLSHLPWIILIFS